jgi:hypothetical protein
MEYYFLFYRFPVNGIYWVFLYLLNLTNVWNEGIQLS